LTPEIPSISTHPGSASASANPPLSAIAERRSGSAESEDDEDDEEEGGWKTAYGHGKRKGSAEEEGVIKAGYLWKKGERRKVQISLCLRHDSRTTKDQIADRFLVRM
jgi:hypothetical protein